MAQGTIKEFDGEARIGVLLMEDRSEVRIDPASLEGAGIRTLRLGQRVRFDLADEAGAKVARSLRLVTVD
ncbi:MAG: cold shock domain-containing protein [Actinobacteria bacterium]|nr:cold shock domain-containing protein [Actinomycetota bacterium]